MQVACRMHHPGKNRTYPLKLILDAVSTFNLGYSITDTRSVLRRHFHVDVPDRTINSWLTTYRSVSTYARLRAAGKKLFDPRSTIVTRFFEHRQVYRFQVHNAKLGLSLRPPIHGYLSPLRGYLTAVQRDLPHHLFQNTAERSSTFPASNDSVTVAVEVPVFLTQEDIRYYRSCGFDVDFESDVITGHIDFLQIRNGHIHILDYKPDARKETHAHVQLTIYA